MEEVSEELEAEYRHMSGEFNRRKLEGLSILDAIKYEQVLRAMEREIEEARERLRELQKQCVFSRILRTFRPLTAAVRNVLIPFRQSMAPFWPRCGSRRSLLRSWRLNTAI